jgi:hypothetical protein
VHHLPAWAGSEAVATLGEAMLAAINTAANAGTKTRLFIVLSPLMSTFMLHGNEKPLAEAVCLSSGNW